MRQELKNDLIEIAALAAGAAHDAGLWVLWSFIKSVAFLLGFGFVMSLVWK